MRKESFNNNQIAVMRYARQKAAVASKVKGQIAEYQVRQEQQAADVEALKAMQAARPLKPPGQR